MPKQGIELPLWLPLDTWEGYIEMRRRIKKPMTEYAKKLALNRLAELAAQGFTPSAVLEQSIFNCWQGLFEVRIPEKRTPVSCVSVGRGPQLTEQERERLCRKRG